MIWNQLLPQFFLPLGVSLILLTYGVVRRRRGVQATALVVLLLASNPIVANRLIRMVEGHAVRVPASEMQTADAIVVLSAGRRLPPRTTFVSEWGDANRFFGGLELWRAGKAPRLVFTRPPINGQPPDQTEGDLLAALARELGVPAANILLTGPVLNTADEAREVMSILRQDTGRADPTVLLVTSAFHLPRARQQFEAAGHIVIPFAVHFQTSGRTSWSVFDVIPSVGALRHTHIALRELYGRAFYWVVARLRRH
jgi:uncharacterized SAM-binding protein YcdF (DUF218 family)